jgi:3-dehydrotetronate 4-kinase
VPHAETCPADVDAVAIALKSSISPAPEAVQESLAALRWLQDKGTKIDIEICDSTLRCISPTCDFLGGLDGKEEASLKATFPAPL